MLETSAAYQEAIVGGVRYIVPRAVMEVIDPDINFGTATGSAQGPYSKPEELHDRIYEAAAFLLPEKTVFGDWTEAWISTTASRPWSRGGWGTICAERTEHSTNRRW